MTTKSKPTQKYYSSPYFVMAVVATALVIGLILVFALRHHSVDDFKLEVPAGRNSKVQPLSTPVHTEQ